MKARRRARGWTLRLLYAWEAKGERGSLVNLLDEFLADRRVADQSRVYIRRLAVILDSNRDEIDQSLTAALTNWRLDRLAAIDRNILRLAAAEMLFVPDVPPRVSIQEAIALAETYGTAESPRFVNGVLDALMRRMGPTWERDRRASEEGEEPT